MSDKTARRRERLARATKPREAATTETLIEVRGWAAHTPDDCAVAAKVTQLVRDIDTRWAIDPEACRRCGRPTVALHEAEGLWACLACGSHGELHTMPSPVIPAGPLMTDGGEILH